MVEAIRKGIIRVQSSMNEWIDCIFLVDEEKEGNALEVLEKAWNDFWKSGEGWCFGEFLESRLAEENIEFDVYYADMER